ncbi:MAG: AAA family ATPase [Anaerolineaceae bacterium]|nr:AAA family ATPase [Anaerolineaceae bacterium]
MIQLESLEVENFRSIKQQRVDFAPITVFYGPNGSGKSSLLYSLLLMKNVLLNLERQSGDFYNFGFANLGNFRAVVFNHDIDEWIRLYLKLNVFNLPVTWSMQIQKKMAGLGIQIVDQDDHSFNASVGFRHPFMTPEGEQNRDSFRGITVDYYWDGINGTVRPEKRTSVAASNVHLLTEILKAPAKHVRKVAIAPLQMAFSKGEHLVAKEDASLNSTLYFSEDAVGTLLATRRYLQSPVSKYLEEITNRTLRVFSPPGDPNFSINVADQNTGLETELVNDGYGVNRVAWLLALTLHDETRLMCIEEPETHLHPTSIRKLVKTFVNIMRNEDKRFLFTTHSEVFALAILSEVARGHLKPDDVAFYLTSKEGKETKFERQEINKHGQVEGGLTSFMEGELEDLAVLYGETS